MTEPQLVDAQTMHLHNPDSFWVPTQEEVEQAIEERRCVKVCIEGERFWVEPSRTEAGKHYGWVANVLVTADLSIGEEICFTWRNVYDIEH